MGKGGGALPTSTGPYLLNSVFACVMSASNCPNIPVERWATDAIRDGEICFMIKEVLNMKGPKKFNNRTHQDYSALRLEYQQRKHINYIGTETNKPQCRRLIGEYVESRRLAKVSHEDRHLYTISPLNCIETKPGKFSLITHSLINSCYRKKDMNLLDITRNGETLHEIDEFRTEDLHGSGFKKIIKMKQKMSAILLY